MVKNSDNLIDKFLQSSYSNSEVEQILLEEKCTMLLQRHVEFANAKILKNFSLSLQMDEDEVKKRIETPSLQH